MKNYNKMYDEPRFKETAEFAEEVEVDPEPSKEELGVVNAREVYIRKGPGKDYEHVGTVKKDDELIILDSEDGFLKIETQDGVMAYIMESFVDVIE